MYRLLKSNPKRVPGGTRKMLLLYVERVPSFCEIGKAQGKQRGPWTIEGSLMYLVARENGNSRVNTKWSNGKDKGRQYRWKQKWGTRLAGRGNGFANACIYRTYLRSWMMEKWKWSWFYSCSSQVVKIWISFYCLQKFEKELLFQIFI